MELMGGTIFFESAEGVGSTFSFTVPMKEAGENDTLPTRSVASAEPAAEPAAGPEGEGMPYLLLAEDDTVIRQLVGVMLKRANYHLDIAENGLRAIEMWGKGAYDLVLMDVQMPELNGFEATRIIREKERERGGHTPIIAMTAHARKEDEENCLAAGMDAYISKPIDFQNCLQVIGKFIKPKSSEYAH